MMRVLIDARSMQTQPKGGVARGLACLLPHLATLADVELMTAADRPPLKVEAPQHPLPTPWPGTATGWLQWSAPRFLRHQQGVFHCPWYALPFRQPVPMVVTLHDLTFEHHPEWFRRGQAIGYRAQARWAARTARVILAPSQSVAEDITSTYRVSKERVVVVPNAVDPVFYPTADPSEQLRRLGLRDNYVVAIGGAARRNAHVAVAAWRAVRRTHDVDLLLVGPETVPQEAGLVRAAPSDEDWARLLAGARALLYPTAYEGFGMPALESIASGTPVLCSRVGALPDVLGDAAVWCRADDAADMADRLRALLDDDALAASLVTAGLERANAWPSWAEVSGSYADAYRRAADG
jgi:glycosyltransferase involved in cell wall biosynthesis